MNEQVFESLAKVFRNALREINFGIINAFWDGLEYLKNNIKKFVTPVLILNGNIGFLVNEKDAIDFDMDSENKDKSLIIYREVSHMIWLEEKGDLMVGNILEWIQRWIK